MDAWTESLELLHGLLFQNAVKKTSSLHREGDQAYSFIFSIAHEMRCLRLSAPTELFPGRPKASALERTVLI